MERKDIMATCPVCGKTNVHLFRCPACGEIRCNTMGPTCPGTYGMRSGETPGNGYTCLGCKKGKYIELPF